MIAFKTRITLSVLLPFCVTGCETFSKTKRYDSVISLGANKGDMEWQADVLVLPAPASKSKSKTLADLPERAQKAVIEAASKDGEAMSAQSLGALMATKVAASKQQVNRDWTKVKRRIAVSIDYTRVVDDVYAPADRLDQVRASFGLSQPTITDAAGNPISIPAIKFDSWSRLENQRRKLDLAELVFSQGSEFGADAGLTTLSPDLDTLDLSGKVTRGLTETLKLKEDQLSIYGALDDDSVFYVERGAPLTDLGGMTLIDVTMELPHDPRLPFGVETFKLDGADPKLSGGIYQVPNTLLCDQVIEIQPEVTVTSRHVVSGGSTYLEGDDKVAYITETATLSAVPFLDVGEVNERALWGLYAGPVNDPDVFVIVRNQNSSNLQDPSFFTSRSAASKLLDWLGAEIAKPGNSLTQPIVVDGYELIVREKSGGAAVSPRGAALTAAVNRLVAGGVRVSDYGCS